MEFRKIKYFEERGVAKIKMDSPKNLNALDEPMVDELSLAIDRCADDETVKVVIISGEGKSFSAGGDIGMMLEGLKSGEQRLGAGVRKAGLLALKIRNLGKPVIASVHGSVAGAGFNFALLCDFRIAAENTKFIQAFVNIGLVPDMGGTFLLTRTLGVSKATELIMTGKPINAKDAYSLGLVSEVVPLEELEDTAVELADKLSNLPSIALGKMKTLINRAAFQGFENNLDNETEYQMQCANTNDFKEGIYAFAEKRKANFQGK